MNAEEYLDKCKKRKAERFEDLDILFAGFLLILCCIAIVSTEDKGIIIFTSIVGWELVKKIEVYRKRLDRRSK